MYNKRQQQQQQQQHSIKNQNPSNVIKYLINIAVEGWIIIVTNIDE